MAKGSNKISITTVDKVMKENCSNQITADWYGNEVVIKRNLGFTDMLEFVNDVVYSCMSETNGYMPEILEFAIRCNIVTRYANFSLPEKLEHKYDIVYQSDIVDFIVDKIDAVQLVDIRCAIDDKLDHMCNTNASEIQGKLAELVGYFEEMQNQTKNLFGGMTAGDISAITSAVNNGGINADKIVEAYMSKMSGEV